MQVEYPSTSAGQAIRHREVRAREQREHQSRLCAGCSRSSKRNKLFPFQNRRKLKALSPSLSLAIWQCEVGMSTPFLLLPSCRLTCADACRRVVAFANDIAS